MKHNSLVVPALGLSVCVACILAIVAAGSAGQQERMTGGPRRADHTYRNLYFSRVASDLARFTALMKRMDQSDYSTVTNVMLISVRADLQVVAGETNYPWSQDQRMAIRVARQYVQQIEAMAVDLKRKAQE